MEVNAMKGISNFARPITSPPANVPSPADGEIPANDNLKHDNVQVKVNSPMPDFHDTPSGNKTKINFVA